ncbi:drug resistance transporter, EmrB/QacA subfamily [Goodfellowiella coeruleoviolacea]|uniref:Drug resistance transporter, EmrB/QacA subfamily n=1 Tax=Goodfellowiella coeruleoviolacea TaxID=334858 RepID=A0AAE3GQ47_9PSEU|nr:drug resistance transporter, EmrB/QacA subfamily [Goodfellowiella coeruleoviolacea]
MCLAAGFMTLLDVSIVNVALPSIQEGLRASASDLQWVLSGYALTFGLVLVPAGRLGDATGRRRAFLLGVGLFTLTSVSAGLAVSPLWLSVSRLVQGVAGGLINPQVAGLIQELFRGRERNHAFGWLGASIGIATAAGPITGGLIIALAGPQHGWRWVFLVNLPIGLATIVLGRRLLPAERTDHRVRGLDLVGVALLGLGVLLVMLPMLEAEGGRTRVPWWLVVVGALVVVGFVAWERRCRGRGGTPLVDPELLRSRSYALGVLLGMVYFASFTGIFFVLAVFFQRGLGYSALASGLAVTSFALGSAVAAAVGGRLVGRMGRLLVVLGLVLVVVGLASTDLVLRHWPAGVAAGLATALPLLVAGVGSGLTVSPNQALTLAAVPVRMAGTAAGVLQTGQRIGTAVGIAAMGLAFYGTLADTGADYGRAVTTALWLAVGLALLALLLGLADLLLGRPEDARAR